MPRASEYWSYVRECEHRATKTADGEDRKVFFQMAKAWAELALKEHGALKYDKTIIKVCPTGNDMVVQLV